MKGSDASFARQKSPRLVARDMQREAAGVHDG
jgi:hypothetical protein